MSGGPLEQETVTCAEIEQRDLLASHIAGRLGDAERDLVEAHVIACARCADDLGALLLAREALAAPGGPAPSRSSSKGQRALGLALLVAAAGLVAVLGLPRVTARRTPAPSRASAAAVNPAVLRLAQAEPPAYTPFTVRSADPDSLRFRDAMDAYTRHEFVNAAERLRAVVDADGNNLQARFYRGASLLMVGDAAGAATDFRTVVAAGASPFHDSSQLLLAKAQMRLGDLDGAAATLAEARRGSGPRAAEAGTLFAELAAARTAQRR